MNNKTHKESRVQNRRVGTYFVSVFWLQKHSRQQPKTNDFLLAFVFADVIGECIVALAIVEAGCETLDRLVAPFVFLEGKRKICKIVRRVQQHQTGLVVAPLTSSISSLRSTTEYANSFTWTCWAAMVPRRQLSSNPRAVAAYAT